MFAARFRLKKRTEFAYSYKKAAFSGCALVTLAMFKRKDRLLRIGFSVSKKIGKATVRNKVKRRMRAIIREFLPKTMRGYNLIFLAKPGVENASFAEIKKQIEGLLKRNSLLGGVQ